MIGKTSSITEKSSNGIGTRQEKSLHAALKQWYALPGDRLEVPVEGYQIDIVRGDLLIEIQTRNFSALKQKLLVLLENHPVRLVYPIALEKWILRQEAPGEEISGRKRSPRRGRLDHLFGELVRLPQFVRYPNFTFEVLFTREEELRVNDGKGAWRRKGWSIADRRLVEVVDRAVLETPADFKVFLPPELPSIFTARDLARARGIPAYLARKMVYCLREMGIVEIAGKKRRAYLYRRVEE